MLQRPCRFYNTTGKCRFGKHCKFLHEISLEQGRILHQENQNEAVNTEVSAEGEVIVTPVLPLNPEENENGSLNKISEETTDFSSQKKLCKFYVKNGYCSFGSRCRFAHVRKPKFEGSKENLNKKLKDGNNKVQDEGLPIEAAENEAELEGSSVKDSRRNKQQRKICRFYKKGYCKFGKRCRQLHPRNDTEENLGTSDSKDEIIEGVAELSVNKDDLTKPFRQRSSQYRPVIPTNVISFYKRDELTEEKLNELRSAEIRQMKRRFPKDKIQVVDESDDASVFVFTFTPTDPDWPYDVRSFDIQISFTANYPLQLFHLAVPCEQDLPETVRRYLEVSLEEWREKKQKEAESKGIAENYLRPFMRWLEKSILDIVTDGLRQLRRELTAKAAGIQFISSAELKKQVVKETQDAAGSQSEDDEVSGTQPVPEGKVYRKSEQEAEMVYECPSRSEAQTDSDADETDDEEENDENTEETEDNKGHTRPQIALDTERRGTELSFGNMRMWFCTTVMMEKLRLSVRCSRCKHETDFSTPPNRINSINCGKCHNEQLVVFRPVLAHTYSSTFGYLDVEGCSLYDVILGDCHMSMGCVTCNRDVLLKKFSPGVQTEIYCRGCHTKMKFACETVKIHVLTSAGIDKSHFSGSVHSVSSKLVRRVPNDPAIKDGLPLPDNGACKHYKKSFRWLRFPCCGKCYPCDICHDIKEDHEMKFASRMICGFCCHEQPFAAEKPCSGCSSALTKVRTSHWEGGRGCRDKISMSRSDDKKYKNMNKTVSTKAQSLKEKTKGHTKKNTKLRHT